MTFTPEDTFVFKADEAHTINLRKYRTKAQIYGHMHYNYVRNQNGIYTICTTPVNKEELIILPLRSVLLV